MGFWKREGWAAGQADTLPFLVSGAGGAHTGCAIAGLAVRLVVLVSQDPSGGAVAGQSTGLRAAELRFRPQVLTPDHDPDCLSE